MDKFVFKVNPLFSKFKKGIKYSIASDSKYFYFAII